MSKWSKFNRQGASMRSLTNLKIKVVSASSRRESIEWICFEGI